jgi:2-polyprenyl-3-methyl-5-hydroxy-6-metoxy-1,4-benzoquinol methylase
LERIYTCHHSDGLKYGRLRARERGLYLAEWIGKGKEVLDLGCRDGELTRYFCADNKVLGVDVDRKALDLAKDKLGIETRWVDLNVEFPFAPESFDVVVACEVLEHVYHPQMVVERIHSALRPGRLFAGSVPNAFRFGNRMKFLLGQDFDKDPMHLHVFSRAKLRTMLSEHFRDVEIVPVGGCIVPGLRISRRTPRLIGVLCARGLLWRCVK